MIDAAPGSCTSVDLRPEGERERAGCWISRLYSPPTQPFLFIYSKNFRALLQIKLHLIVDSKDLLHRVTATAERVLAGSLASAIHPAGKDRLKTRLSEDKNDGRSTCGAVCFESGLGFSGPSAGYPRSDRYVSTRIKEGRGSGLEPYIDIDIYVTTSLHPMVRVL